MKKILLYFVIFFIIAIPVFAQTVIKSGVEVKRIPNSFFGNWRVSSNLVSTNNNGMFKKHNIDFWNLSREDNVIKLENPFSGASQSIEVTNVNKDFIKFVKVGNYSGMKLTDTVTITLGKNNFYGVNALKLDKISDIDGHVIKTYTATYNLKGEKLSGTSIGE